MSDARPGSELFIVDNSESDWKGRDYLVEWCDMSKTTDSGSKTARAALLPPKMSTTYHRIVVALSETFRLMAEIDEVIERHGGWPGAFSTIAQEAS